MLVGVGVIFHIATPIAVDTATMIKPTTMYGVFETGIVLVHFHYGKII